MANFKSIFEKKKDERNWIHLFEVAFSCVLSNAGWALKRYTRHFTNICLTMDFDTVCFRNVVGDCFDMLSYGKPVFEAYQCHITIPTKLTIPPRMEDLYFS